MLASTAMFGSLFGFINSAQQVFAEALDAPGLFTTVFALAAGCMAVASFLNSRIVERIGMRPVSHAALLGFIAISGVHALVALAGQESLWTFAAFQGATMFCFGLVGVNFNAMAMEPLGRIAGTGSSLLGSVTTIGGALIGFYIGQQFDGTVVPLTVGFVAFGLTSLIIVMVTENGRLFRPTQSPR
jgi:DHA1 family bicyclomycin/chloramphenicol resistance-like MFS transporter